MQESDLLVERDLFGEPIKRKASGPVAEKFIIPPFTILDAKSGEWQERKREWMATGLKSEKGRGDGQGAQLMKSMNAMAAYAFSADATEDGSGTSVFDPVLCEVAYRWWSPPSGLVLDPFAGGSVRGIIAGALGRRYYGIDLREEQVVANREQAAAIGPKVTPTWVCGDSTEEVAKAPAADFVFSCPPYGDLEVYSDDPRDISNMDFHAFAAAYKRIIAKCVERMQPDTFACFVVGDFRDKHGIYRKFPGMTIAAFEAAGARLYNEAILATPIGTACLRVTRQFSAGRKLAKIHQNVLTFVKGDWKRASHACGELK
jgi:hypothetical protein